jgi:hypothetical protein
MTNEVTVPEGRVPADAAVHVPSHVVCRQFAAEAVVLNLETGKYHGLNSTAGRIFDALETTGSVQAATAQIAAEFEHPLADVEADVRELCESLVARGLIELR